MLRSFRVANHRSIRDEQELVLVPAYDTDRDVVPVAAIFGANAAGKSNVLDALRFLQEAVRSSYVEWEPRSGTRRTPFRLDTESADDPSTFVVDLLLDSTRYIYGISMDGERITDEWLYSYPQKRRRSVFERDRDKLVLGSTIPDHQHRSRRIGVEMRDNASALGTAARANLAEVMPVYEWFRAGLDVQVDSFGVKASVDMVGQAFSALTSGNEQVIGLLREADLGIAAVSVDEPSHDPAATRMWVRKKQPQEKGDKAQGDARSDLGVTWDDLAAGMSWGTSPSAAWLRVRFLHGKDQVPLSVSEQSAGTMRWLTLVTAAVDRLDRGGVLCVDEIDASLHPRLTARLIGLFRDRETNPRSAQLIFTSHDASLLGTALGDEVLRRDEVWFVEKDARGATTLFPLTDFKPRTGENRERRYLGGSYGAVPLLSDMAFQRIVKDYAGAA
jgi:hypothetical protein